MKILADANPLFSGPLTGIGYYTQSLLSSVDSNPRATLEAYAFNFLGKNKSPNIKSLEEQKLLPGKLLSYPRYLGVELPLEFFFNTKGFDVILGTNYLLPPNLRNIPSIATIHDLCFIDHPEWVQSKNAHILEKLLPNTIRRSSGIITISEFSLSRIREVYNYTGPALVVDIPPKPISATPKQPRQVSLKSGKYFLIVGTIEPRKNLGLALDAFEKLPTEIQNSYPLILAGKVGWDLTILNRLKSGKNPNVMYLEYVTEEERSWLYKNATATLVTSLYEGFGMMTLESIAMGTPTITSDIPPQREILGQYGEYFNPKDSSFLAGLLKKFTEESYRNQSLEKQHPVLEKYSWDIVANSIISFIEKLLMNDHA